MIPFLPVVESVKLRGLRKGKSASGNRHAFFPCTGRFPKTCSKESQLPAADAFQFALDSSRKLITTFVPFPHELEMREAVV